ncbi:MAG: hypothetical protein QOJ44_518 [Acidimicrobiaceae bacterium]|nr:hypothetical protein [Acidimicrobiaceae bacterium]
MTAITKMNLMANQITPTTKWSRANATKAAMTPPPINSTRSKVLSPDRSSLTAINAIAALISPVGTPRSLPPNRLGGTVH